MRVQDQNRVRHTTVVVAVVCLVCQLAVVPQLGPLSGWANLCLVYAVCMALFRGGTEGVVCGFVAGLVFDLSSTGPVGLMALLLTVAAYLLGSEGRNRLAEDAQVAALQGGVACLAVSVAYALFQLALGQASSLVEALFLRGLPSGVLSFVCLLPFLWALSRPSRQATLGGSGRHGMPRSQGPRLGRPGRRGGGLG